MSLTQGGAAGKEQSWDLSPAHLHVPRTEDAWALYLLSTGIQPQGGSLQKYATVT
jgi:hypothetical protein